MKLAEKKLAILNLFVNINQSWKGILLALKQNILN